MGNSSLIGALAIFTIGAVLVIGILAFGRFLRDPKNREHAHRALVRDETSAASNQRDKAPLKTRLDHSEASSHPDDPTREQPAP